MHRLFAVVFAACALLAAPALAQSEPSARQIELSRRYVQLAQGDQIESALRQMMATDPSNDLSDLPAEDREFLLDLTSEILADLMPKMMEAMVPAYAATFTEAELEALVAFYDTEMGRSIIDKTFQVLPEINTAVEVIIPELFQKMASRMCARYGCDPRQALAEMYAGAGMEPPSGARAAPPRAK
ncbi:MAG TPA: DUF2059 domain-containing protein [Brevundimonas sp.]